MVEWLRRIVRVMRGGGVGKNSVKDKQSSDKCLVFLSDNGTGKQRGKYYIGETASEQVYCSNLDTESSIKIFAINLGGTTGIRDCDKIEISSTPPLEPGELLSGIASGSQKYKWSKRKATTDTCKNLKNISGLKNKKIFPEIEEGNNISSVSLDKIKKFPKPAGCGDNLKYHLVTDQQAGNCRGSSGILAQYKNINPKCVQGCQSGDGNQQGGDIIQVWT